MNIIFNIIGGIGKCIASTAVLKAIKTQYPDSKVIVISQFPQLFKNNPNLTTQEIADMVGITKNQAIGIKNRGGLCKYTSHLQGISKTYKDPVDKREVEKLKLIKDYANSIIRLTNALQIKK